MFWKGDKTTLVDVCLERIRMFHPDFNVIIFNDNIETVDGYNSLSVQHQSDWVRICAIEKYGGIWLDATVFLMKPVTEWVDMNKMQLQGFSAPFSDNCLENWAFAAPQNDQLVRAWKKEFKRAIEMVFDKFKEDQSVSLENHGILDRMPYLTMHGCYIIASKQTNMTATMEKSCDGPYKYLCRQGFESTKAINYLTREDIDVPLIKFRNDEKIVFSEIPYKEFLFISKYHKIYTYNMYYTYVIVIYTSIIFVLILSFLENSYYNLFAITFITITVLAIEMASSLKIAQSR